MMRRRRIAERATEPRMVSKLVLTVTRGVAAGWIAGVPQVLLSLLEGRLLGVPERGAIGPRFIRRATEHAGRRVSGPVEWLLAGVFHFEYAAWWGALYALAVEALGHRRLPPLLGGALLGGVIYAAAFSRLGGATRTGAEPPPEARSPRESLVHWTAALTFALTTALTYRWLRERW